MNKLILTLAFVGSMILNAQAQTTLSLGLRGGVNLTTLQNDDLENNKYAYGITAAIPVEIGFNKHLAIQPELTFIQKGVAYDFNDATPKVDKQTRTYNNYLELPILFKAKIGNDVIKGYAIAGPSVGYAISKYGVTINGDDRNSDKIDFVEEGSQTDNLLDLGATFGLGGEFNVGPGAIVIDARYNLDLNDNTSFENDAPNNWKTTKNSGIAISLGYTFKF